MSRRDVENERQSAAAVVVVDLASNDELVAEVVDADDGRDAEQCDEREEQLEAHECRQLGAQVLVARQLLAYLRIHRHAEKRNQFSSVRIILVLDRNCPPLPQTKLVLD